MKKINHLSDTRFAHHLRLSSDRSVYFLRILSYMLVGILGIIMAVFTNATGVRYDSEGGVVYRQAYRIQISENLIDEVDRYKHGRVFDFTTAIPTEAVSYESFVYDSQEVLKESKFNDNVIIGLPLGQTYEHDTYSFYLPTKGELELPIAKVFNYKNIEDPTVYLPAEYYEIYNRSFEAVFSTEIYSKFLGTANVSLKSLAFKQFGKFKDVDIEINIDDHTFDNCLSKDRTIGDSEEVLALIDGKTMNLKVKIVETETKFSYDNFADYGTSLKIGKTLLFDFMENAYKSRKILDNYEDQYHTFNDTVPFETSFSTVYSVLSLVVLFFYGPLLLIIFYTSVKSRQIILRLSKAGFAHHISCREYTLTTVITSVIAITISLAVLGTLSPLLPSLGNMVWFNALDYILIAVINLLIAGLDIFVATRRRGDI